MINNSNINSEKSLQAVLDQYSAVVFVKDLNNRHLLVNQMFLDTLGLQKEDVIGKTTHDIFPEEYAEILIADDEAVLNSTSPLQKEEIIPVASGTRHYQITKFPLLDNNDSPWGICGISTDITRQRISDTILRISEEKFSKLFELSPIGIALWETDGYLVEANQVFLDTIGYSKNEILNIQYKDIASGDDTDNRITELLMLAENPDSSSIETRYIQKNGDDIPVELYAFSLASERGNQRIWSLVIDLRASKQAEQEIQDKSRSFELIFRKNPEPLCITEVSTGLIIDANDSFLKTSHYTYEEVVGLSTLDLKLWKHPTERNKVLEELSTKGSVKSMIVEGLTAHNETRTFDISCDVITIDDRQVLLSSAKDITEKRRYEMALSRIAGAMAYDPNENLLQKITGDFAETMEADIAFVGVLSDKGNPPRIKTLNVITDGKATDNFDYELTHTPCEKLIRDDQCIFPENIQGLFPRDIMLQDMGIEAYLGSTLLASDGRDLGILVALFRRKIDETGVIPKLLPIYASVVAGEIERLQAQDEQLELEKQLQVKQKMELVGRLSAGIAHDFNNILASIMGYSDLASMIITDEQGKLKRFLGEINKASVRARDLVEKLLTFSRKDSGDPEAVDVNKVIDETLGILTTTTPATTTIKTRSSLDAGHKHIYIDPVQLQQVFVNLLINARDAIKGSGSIEIFTSFEHIARETRCDSCDESFIGEFIKVSIRDSGEGIDPDVGSGLFTPFYSTRKPGEAAGLGLSVVHGIVHSHQGHVTLESARHKGTEICLYLPPANFERLDDVNKTEMQDVSAVDPHEKHILVVDDEAPITALFKTLLENKGYRVIATTDSEKALGIIRSRPESLSLVITDQVMPRVTGLQIAKESKKIRPALPVFLCSGYNEIIGDISLGELTLDENFSKPVDSDKLLEKVEEILSRQTDLA